MKTRKPILAQDSENIIVLNGDEKNNLHVKWMLKALGIAFIFTLTIYGVVFPVAAEFVEWIFDLIR